MICTITARDTFGRERLQYIREFNSGSSCVAYWLAKILWNIISVQKYTLCYSLALYWIMPIPAQNYWTFFFAFGLAAWDHTGLGMLFSVVFVSPVTSLCVSVFAPMILEIAFSGGLVSINDMSRPQRLLSAISCGRWFKQTLYIFEMREYPEHTLTFPAVVRTLEDYEITSLNDVWVGIVWLFFWGAFFRVWTLVVLALLKHAEGNNCIGRMLNLAAKHMAKLGWVINGPKPFDASDTVEALSRQPSRGTTLRTAEV